MNLTGKTHVAVGLATTSMLLSRTDFKSLIDGVGLATIGALLVDCDVRSSEVSMFIRQSFIIGLVITTISVLCSLIFKEYKNHPFFSLCTPCLL